MISPLQIWDRLVLFKPDTKKVGNALLRSMFGFYAHVRLADHLRGFWASLASLPMFAIVIATTVYIASRVERSRRCLD